MGGGNRTLAKTKAQHKSKWYASSSAAGRATAPASRSGTRGAGLEAPQLFDLAFGVLPGVRAECRERHSVGVVTETEDGSVERQASPYVDLRAGDRLDRAPRVDLVR